MVILHSSSILADDSQVYVTTPAMDAAAAAAVVRLSVAIDDINDWKLVDYSSTRLRHR